MAEAIVSFVVGKLGDLIIEEARLLHGVRHEIEWIERELKRMRCFLKDADAKQKEDDRIRNWVAEIREISYKIEDVIDKFISKGALRRTQGSTGPGKWHLKTNHKIGREIQDIKEKISEISSSRLTYGIRDINEGGLEATSTNQNLHDRRRYFALFNEGGTDFVGFKKERQTLKGQLINGDSRRAVISIVGMGGSGKTTLTQKVYHDVKHYFECHAFIHLSQRYKIRDSLINIIKGVMGGSQEEKIEMERATEQELGKKLSDHLIEKRYLVVIDDIWNMEAWDLLNLVLPDGLNKSRVMLTTRIEEVALHADSSRYCHKIGLLNDEDSWELFLKKIFPRGSACPLELENLEGIGRQILKKCRHLPLAIVLLGGLLSRKDKTLSAWSKVHDSITWQPVESSPNECMEILALSYYDLPHYLKPCFLYLGLFPEDFEIESERIIRLWIAEGFIQERGREILEDVAEDYLEELIGRSMLQVASKRCDNDGSIRTCRIHDLLRELSISEAKHNCFFEIIGDGKTISSSTSKHRCLALHHNTGNYNEIIYHSALRSLLCFHDCELDQSKLFSRSGKLLRVLDVEEGGISTKTIPKEMGEFVHLRYLSFGTKLSEVHPTCLTFLKNLQTLKLIHGVELPNKIWDLERLRHLDALYSKIAGQSRLNNLRNLQTLCLQAGSWIESGLDKLKNLRKLGMSGDIGSHNNSLAHSIEKLSNLRSLTITNNGSNIPFRSFTHHSRLYKMHLVGPIKELPDLPPNLTKLTLRGSHLKQGDIAKLEKLPRLQIE